MITLALKTKKKMYEKNVLSNHNFDNTMKYFFVQKNAFYKFYCSQILQCQTFQN